MLAGKTLVNKLGAVNNLLNMKMTKGKQIKGDIAKIETKFVRLAAMSGFISKSME